MMLFSGLFGFLSFIVEPYAVFDAFNELCLVAFGVLLFILDAPLHFRWVLEAKHGISRFVRLLTRYTGKGIFLMLQSCMLFNCLWNERVSYFFAIVFSCYVFAIGFIATAVGATKSAKLNRVRHALASKGEQLPSYLKEFVNQHPPSAIKGDEGGLARHEFGTLCHSVDPGIVWTNDDLRQIFIALACERGGSGNNLGNLEVLGLHEIREWLEPGHGVML